jgi:MFS family permease
VEGLDRPELLWRLLIMAIALSLGALLWGVAVDRLRRRGVGLRTLLGLVSAIFIAAQLALILRLPLPSHVPWIVVAAVGAGSVVSYAILAEYFPKELAGRANAALNLFHIGGAFVVQFGTGLVVQLWAPTDGQYPVIAYQTAFAFNVGFQIVAGIWFAQTSILTRLRRVGGSHMQAFCIRAPRANLSKGKETFSIALLSIGDPYRVVAKVHVAVGLGPQADAA